MNYIRHISAALLLFAVMLTSSSMAAAADECCPPGSEARISASAGPAFMPGGGDALTAESTDHSAACCDSPTGECGLPCCAAAPGAILGLAATNFHTIIAPQTVNDSTTLPSGPASDIFHPPQA